MEPQVAIPTYDRPEIILRTTLAYLERSDWPTGQTTIWVSGEGQVPLYDSLPAHWRARIRVGARGLQENRLAAERTYPEGTPLVWINDDVSAVRQLDPTAHRNLSEVPIGRVIADGFNHCAESGAHLWGIYAVDNHFFMKERVHTDLRYIVGCFYGVVLRHDDSLQPVFGDAKEDYERVMRFYEKDGAVVRMDRYCPRTTYYNSPDIFPNVELIEANIVALEERWPGWVKRNARRRSGYPEILVKDPARGITRRQSLDDLVKEAS
jgi:hypothetical protein